MRLASTECRNRLVAADHGVLSTTGPDGLVDAVPVCYAVVSNVVATPVDQVKPKRTTQLARVTNLARDPRATLLVEHWDPDDWSRLWWVRARLTLRRGHATDPSLIDEGAAALRAKYAQYAATPFARLLIFELDPGQLSGWSSSG